MLGNIGNPFVKHMQQVTKGHLYHLSGICISMYIGRRLNGIEGENFELGPFSRIDDI